MTSFVIKSAELRDGLRQSKIYTEAEIDCLMLQLNNLPGSNWIHHTINERAALAAKIAACAKDGKVRVEESGRDCDCVEYSGRVRTIDANVRAFMKLRSEIGEWADGPFQLTIIPFELEIEYESRDLVMEAREDGRHTIYSRFPG